MLAKCANPSCSILFKQLREGRLLRVDKNAAVERHPIEGRRSAGSARPSEYYWLCGLCSVAFNLAFDLGSGMVLIPLADDALSNPPILDLPPYVRERRRTASVA
jgi:hypothetical protein